MYGQTHHYLMGTTTFAIGRSDDCSESSGQQGRGQSQNLITPDSLLICAFLAADPEGLFSP